MELWKYLQQSKKPIVLYGMGNGADRILDILHERGIQVAGVFASDGFVRHQSFRGFTVCSYDELKEKFGEMTVLLAFGTHRPEVIANVLRIMKVQEVYAPDVPIAGRELFDETFVSNHLTELKEVYGMLADEQSKKVFENVVRAKLTGEILPLLGCESKPKEAYDLIGLGKRERYLDIGAYTGDTVLRFLKWTDGQYERIDAVEPDRRNFQKLLLNTEHLANVFCHHCCLDQQIGTRYFAMDGGRKSKVLTEGDAILAQTVDHLLDGKEVSLIKMDVEGMESAVLKGASHTIRRFKPRMDVAAYHRSEDLFSLPLLVRHIQPNVQVYLRHFASLPAWDTNFYFKW